MDSSGTGASTSPLDAKKINGTKDESLSSQEANNGGAVKVSQSPEASQQAAGKGTEKSETPPPEIVEAARQMMGGGSRDEEEARLERLEGNLSKSSGLLPLMYR